MHNSIPVCGFESVHKCPLVDGLNNVINLIDTEHISPSLKMGFSVQL